MGIEGRVFLQFDVSAEGEISNIKVVRDIGGGCGNGPSEYFEISQMESWITKRKTGKV